MTSLVVERWHFRMLNDAARNRAYAAAIARAVAEARRRKAVAGKAGGPADQAVTVLDIGAGTGILSIMAAQAGAERVYACEMNVALAALARACVAQNAASEVVSVLNAHSTALYRGMPLTLALDKAQDRFPPQGADIVVTELVDAGLLGEHVIPVLRHAFGALAAATGSRIVIPHRACVSIALIESAALRRRRRLLSPAEGGMAAAVAALRPEAFVCHRLSDAYTCEPLDLLPHRQLAPTAASAMVLEFAEGTTEQVVELTFTITQQGRVDALALWWDMHLLEGTDDERYCVSSRPGRGLACGWDQALYPLDGYHAAPGMQVRAEVRHDATQFWVHQLGVGGAVAEGTAPGPAEGGTGRIKATDLGEGRKTVTPAQAGAAGAIAARMCKTRPTPNLVEAQPAARLEVEVGELDMATLNDGVYQRAVLADFEVAAAAERGGFCLLVLARDWSYWALAAARHPGCQRVCIAVDSEGGAAALRRVAEGNGMALENLMLTTAPPAAMADGRLSDLVGHLVEQQGGVPGGGGQSTRRVILVADVIEGSGLLRQGMPHQLASAMSAVAQHGGALAAAVPSALAVHARAFASAAVDAANAVHSHNTAGVDVSLFNSFRVSLYRELDLDNLRPMQWLSKEVQAWTMHLSPEAAWARSAQEGGVTRAAGQLEVTAAGTTSGIAFWFAAYGARGLIYSTGPRRDAAGDDVCHPSHARQAAAMASLTVEAGTRLAIEVCCHPATGVEVWSR